MQKYMRKNVQEEEEEEEELDKKEEVVKERDKRGEGEVVDV